MDINKIVVTIDGKPYPVSNVKFDFSCRDYFSFAIEGIIPGEIYNHPQCKSTFCLTETHERSAMSALQTIPENLEQFLDDNYKALYQLGWVDSKLNLTQDGEENLTTFLFKKNVEEFGKVAQDKVTEIKSKEKKESN